MTETINYTTIEAQLAEATREGAVSLELLDAAVESTHPDGYEGIPYSQGLRWIFRHTQLFLELLEAAGSSVEEFYRRHLNNFHVGEDLLNNEWLLLALGDEHRAPFVREVFLAAGAAYDHWLETALRVNLSKSDLAEMILEKLRQTKVEFRYNVINFTKHAFMENGSGRMYRLANGRGRFEEPNSYWGILDDEQLLAAMRIVAETAPNTLFTSRGFNESFSVSEKLRLRLGNEKVNDLLALAAKNLQSLDLVSQDVLVELPLDMQLDLARRLAPLSGVWVLQAALRQETVSEADSLLGEFREMLKEHCISAYTWWVNEGRKLYHKTQASSIDTLLKRLLEEQRYRVGVLSTGQHRGRSQFQVRVGVRQTFVMDRRQTTYELGGGKRVWPADGDVVLFRPEAGRALIPGKVFAVSFTLVRQAGK